MDQNAQKAGMGQRWSDVRPTKTAVAWSWIGVAAATMIVGFTWGGWVTGATARGMAETSGEDAVVKRLAPMCMIQFEQDPKKDQKLKEVTGTDSWQRSDYVKKQGWATMLGEQEPDGKVADACVKLLMAATK